MEAKPEPLVAERSTRKPVSSALLSVQASLICVLESAVALRLVGDRSELHFA